MSAARAFPAALTDPRAFAIARAMLEGFDRHYRRLDEAESRHREAVAAVQRRYAASAAP